MSVTGVLKAVTGLAVATSASGLRKSARAQAETKLVAGVPIHNYNLRDLQHDGASAEIAEMGSEDYDWVVTFKEGLGNDGLRKFCGGDVGQGSCNVMGNPSGGGVGFVAVRGTEEKLEQMLLENPGSVEFAEPDLAVFTIPELPAEGATSSEHWGLDRMNIQRAQQTGRGVHIYVMDTGTRVSHEDFGGRGIATIDTIAGDGQALECERSGDAHCGLDTHGHGTHCAGSAAGTKWGVAKEAIVHGMRVCCGRGTNTLAGMDWIARKVIRPGLVTMSLGSYGNSMTSKRAVDTLVGLGVAVFVSAGNNDIDSCGKTYAFIESTITVGASDEDDNRASFSNYGSCLDIYAPGVRILSAGHRDDTSSRIMSGTSMATPLAAGAGALLLERERDMSPQKLKLTLISMATTDALGDMQDGDPNFLVNVR